jgi:hypothetical protein
VKLPATLSTVKDLMERDADAGGPGADIDIRSLLPVLTTDVLVTHGIWGGRSGSIQFSLPCCVSRGWSGPNSTNNASGHLERSVRRSLCRPMLILLRSWWRSLVGTQAGCDGHDPAQET